MLATYLSQRQAESKLDSMCDPDTQNIVFHPKHIANAFQNTITTYTTSTQIL